MKIDINLEDIFEDNDGNIIKLSLSERIIESVAEKILRNDGSKLTELLEKKLSNEVDKHLLTVLDDKLIQLFDSLIDYEFVPVDTYGRRDQPSTVRKRIIKTLEENCKFVKSSWSSDKNAFTKVIESTVEKEIEAFRGEMRKLLTSEFKKAVLSEAVKLLSKELK